MILLDGRKTARELEVKLKEKVLEMAKKFGRCPKLVVLLVGDNPASLSYVKSKEKACKRVGIDGFVLRLDKAISQESLLRIIKELNEDDKVDGFIVQLPLPKHIDQNEILNNIDQKRC